jgi:hypothetical protein
MKKIISMLLIGLMLAGCGKVKDFINPSASANADLKSEEALKAKNKVEPDANKDGAESSKAENTKGLWNWRLSEDGWMSWISSKTIATASAVLIISVAGYHMLFNKASAPKGGPAAGGGGPATK